LSVVNNCLPLSYTASERRRRRRGLTQGPCHIKASTDRCRSRQRALSPRALHWP
jgi:hypothetical protein